MEKEEVKVKVESKKRITKNEIKEKAAVYLKDVNKIDLNLNGWFAIFAVLSMVFVVGWVVVMFISSLMGWNK